MKLTRLSVLAFVGSIAILVSACSSSGSNEETQVDENVGTSEQEQRTCNFVALCAIGYHFDDRSCHCVKDHGEKCGTKTCPVGEVCCNASCGICTAPGGACIQIACAPR